MENKQSVLVIDDSPTVRRLAELVLSHEGYAVFTAGDGDDGLQIAKKEVPSLIIVDFIMPKMNGFQLCKNIRSDPILNEVPIVLITSKGKDVGQGFDEKFGIVQYLQKPFETETLARTVKEVLAGREEYAGPDPVESDSGELSGRVVTNVSAYPQIPEAPSLSGEAIPILSEGTEEEMSSIDEKIYGGSGEEAVAADETGNYAPDMKIDSQIPEAPSLPGEAIPILSEGTEEETSSIDEKIYGGSGEEAVAADETGNYAADMKIDSQIPEAPSLPGEAIPILSEGTEEEMSSIDEKIYGGSGEEAVATDETAQAAADMRVDLQIPEAASGPVEDMPNLLETTIDEGPAGGEEALPEEVSEHVAADAATDPQMSVETDKQIENIPFVEINKGDNMLSEKFVPKILSPSDSTRDSMDAEPPSTKEISQESSRRAENNAGPVEIPREQDKPDALGYAALQESIEKEFRHYFGRELTGLLRRTMIQTLKETDLVRSSRRILSGEIMYIPVADVMKFIGMSGLSGKLSVLTDTFNSELFLENGRIAFASISKPGYGKCLEDLILKDDKFRSKEVLSALYEARGDTLVAGAILRDRGLITKDELIGHYRELSEDALNQTLAATSGHFYVEDMPLPLEVRDIKLRISSNEV